MALLSFDSLADFHHKLQQWYRQYGRADLPWRNTRDAYAIYVSEIMLQQTQVKTVLERFYTPFLQRFPSLRALADADSEQVLRAWQGLGYYNRALNMHKAAQLCGDALPSTADALLALPGIGRNTAHAVACFGFGERLPVMEANVKRVLCRIFALRTPDSQELWEKAALLLHAKNSFDYNQAMMDIGAMVCTKRSPKCNACPAQGICQGKLTPEAYPASLPRKNIPTRPKTIVVMQNLHGDYYMTPRSTRFLNGLYHFVELEPEAKDFTLDNRSFSVSAAQAVGQVEQQYSHFTLKGEVMLLGDVNLTGKDWYAPDTLQQLPVSNAERKIFQTLFKSRQ